MRPEFFASLVLSPSFLNDLDLMNKIMASHLLLADVLIDKHIIVFIAGVSAAV
jgi:hypothetical protein